MPGKSSAGSTKRLPSGGKKGQVETEEAKKIVFWPEWIDAELNAEKWDTSGKGKDKGKGGGASGTLYEDLDQPRLPSCLAEAVAEWKRPSQYYHEREGLAEQQTVTNPVVVSVDNRSVDTIDLISANEHLMKSKLMCRIMVELHLLWRMRRKFHSVTLEHDPTATPELWSPWQHIQPWPKGQATPMYNPQGKYCVKIHWMGKWRKLTIDDQLPVDSTGHILLPMSANEGELWPLLITKALFKVINLEGVDREVDCYDTSIVQCLTGWFGEEHSLLSNGSSWSSVKPLLRQWERDNTEETTGTDEDSCSVVMAFFQPSPLKTGSSLFVPISDHAHPIVMSKWREEPLELPPLEPPLPEVQAPYYLGLCNRRPRPGYPPPPPPKTDHRSFEVYSPLYSNKPKTFSSTSRSELLSVDRVSVCQSDNWIDLDEFEATFSKIMIFHKPDLFQVMHYDNLPASSATSLAPPPGVKKGASMAQVPPCPTKATGNILVIDHSHEEDVTVYINLSTVCSWYDTGKLIGLESVPTLGLKRPPKELEVKDSSSQEGVKKGEEPVATGNDKETEDTTEPHPQSNEDTSIVPGSLIIQEYTWQQREGVVKERFPSGLPRITTTGSRIVSLRCPRGRCVLRLLPSAPLGYHVDVHSTVPLVMVKEEEVWDVLRKPSRYFLSHGEKVMDILTDLDTDNSQVATTLLQNYTVHHQLTSAHNKALRVSILRVLHVMCPEIGLTTDQLFAWKSRVLTLMETLGQQLQQERKEEEENKGPAINMSAMRELVFNLDGREIKPQDHDKIPSDTGSGRRSNLKKQKPVESVEAVNTEGGVANEEEEFQKGSDLSNEDTMSSDLKNSVELLANHKRDLGVAVFQCLNAAKPDIIGSDPFAFGTSEHSRVYHVTYQGTVPVVEPKGWALLFRDTFTVPCVQKIALKLISSCLSCIVKVIDNDTQSVIGTDLAPMGLTPNEKGYTLIGEVWSLEEALDTKDSWSLALLSSSPYMPTLTSSKDGALATSFSVNETKKYYLPNRDYHMLRYSLTVSNSCHVTLQLTTFKNDACFKLEVLDSDKKVAETEGCGHCVIPSLFLSPTLEEREGSDQPIKTPHQYTVVATVLYDSWLHSDSAWTYISMIKNMQKEATQSNKPSSGKKSRAKGGGSKTPKVSVGLVDTVDISKPHWILRAVTDSKDSQMLKVEEDKSKEEELKLMQQVWEKDQPGRANKAQQLRQKFLDSFALSKDDLATDEERSVAASDVGTGSSVSVGTFAPHFGPVPLKPLNHSQYMKCDDVQPRVIDQEMEFKQQQDRLKKLTEYREWRKEVTVRREIEATLRDENKSTQIQLAEDWQTQVDENRLKLNEARETIRENNLAKLRPKTPTDDTQAAVRPGSKGKDAKGKPAKGKKK